MSTYVTMHRSEAQVGGGDHTTQTLGPFEFVEITYERLSFGEAGEGGVYYALDGMWYPEIRVEQATPHHFHCGPDTTHLGFTDFTIYSKESA